MTGHLITLPYLYFEQLLKDISELLLKLINSAITGPSLQSDLFLCLTTLKLRPSGMSCSAVTAFSSSSALNLATRQLLSAAGAPEVGPTEDRDHQLLP